MRNNYLALMAGCLLCLGADEKKDDDYLKYTIPAGAEAREFNARPGYDYTTIVAYYIKTGKKQVVGGDPVVEDLLTGQRRYYSNNKLHSETIYLADLKKDTSTKHGIEREWFPNGQIHLERPYKNDLAHGTFRQWNDQGKLLGTYEMKTGSGTEKEWRDDGSLAQERERKLGHDNGETRQYSAGKLIHSCWWKEGQLHGVAHGFIGYKNESVEIYLEGKTVTRAMYVEARKKDATLPATKD